MRTSTAFTFAVSALASFASAQTSASGAPATSTVSQSMPATATQGFDASSVDAATKGQWCLGQLNTCPKICGGEASTNICSATDLTYTCTCENGTSPDVTGYMNTLPFYECQETFVQCIAAHPNDADGQATCTSNEKCGTLNATEVEAASSSSAAATTAAATSSTTMMASTTSASATSATAAATTSASSKSNAVALVNTQYATGVFAGLLLVAFKILL